MTATIAALDEIWRALGGVPHSASRFEEHGAGGLPSVFAVSDLAAASIGAAGLALAEWCEENGVPARPVRVDRRLASQWFSVSIRPEGWGLPPAWDPIAGDYRTADEWIRLHTNAPHHRAAALGVLGSAAEREAIAAAVAGWQADALEAAVVEAGGCAAAMRSREAWLDHPQGNAVAAEPLMRREDGGPAGPLAAAFDAARPLRGVKVLDLTRILAGPVATRFLAGFGAQVLRLDPPGWEEPSIAPDVTPGKRCARLDLKTEAGRDVFRALLAEADILVSGYRPDALERAGLGAEARRALNPGLVDVSLDAYGWTGPWAGRRGFDSLVQMSAGIAERGMRLAGAEKPVPLPVQALDHATGYLLAAAAIRGLTGRRRERRGSRWRTSLARVADLLAGLPAAGPEAPFAPLSDADYMPATEETAWGPLRRLLPPLAIEGTGMGFERPAVPLGGDAPRWD